MKRRDKHKRKRLFIIVTALLLFLFITMLLNIGKSKNGIEKNNVEDKETNNEINESDNKESISEIRVSPESYRAFSGESISANTFNVEIVYSSGKVESIKDYNISTESQKLTIQENEINVSKEALTADKELLKIGYDNFEEDIIINIFNRLEDNIDENDYVTNPSAYDVLVNKSRNLSSDYIPEDLEVLDDIPTILQNPEVNQLRSVAHEALKELFKAAKKEKSYLLYARSGYRSYNTQYALYNAYISNHGQEAADKYSARPGQSEHQTGLAMDITCGAMNYQLDDSFGETEEGKWVSENAHRFGFIIRYPKGKESITGYSYEPWHLRYVGDSLAQEIYETGLTLEEYFLSMEE